jgi:hypothetical protein
MSLSNTEIPSVKTAPLFEWLRSQDTYFTITRFRVRCQNILWYLIDDAVNRNYYTYVSTGEICSRYSNLLRSSSSSWITKITQDMTYLSSDALFAYGSMSLVSEACILGVLEAHFQSQFTVNLLQSYFCFEDSLVKNKTGILCNSNPMILRCGTSWYISHEKNVDKAEHLLEAVYRWFVLMEGKMLDTVDISGTTARVLGRTNESCSSAFVEVL